MFLTVFTPTYNRAHTLGRCFESLQRQTDKSFEWIVVDDGSTDDTAQCVQKYMETANFQITYYHQKNSGKHVAHNLGVEKARGDLFVCLDSDDALVDSTVDEIRVLWEKNIRTESYIGILAKRGDFVKRESICGSWPNNVKSSTMYDLPRKYGFYGDTVLFFKTSILKRFCFQQFTDEKFMPESSLYYQLDRIGEMYLVDKVLYLCEYLPDGLSVRYHQLLRNNPKGAAITYYNEVFLAKGAVEKIKAVVLTDIYASLSEKNNRVKFKKNKLLLSLFYIPSVLVKFFFFQKLDRASLRFNNEMRLS